jgi:hemoglobin
VRLEVSGDAGPTLLGASSWEATPGSDLERLGEAKVRAIIERFLDEVFADPMIGFFFRGMPLARIRELELRFAIEHLGGGAAYNGRPLDEAHRRHRVMGGQFDRRREILRETLVAAGVDADIRERWLQHNEAQRGLVVQGPCR